MYPSQETHQRHRLMHFMDNFIMTQNTSNNETRLKNQALAYKQRLNAWALVRLSVEQQRIVVARFRTRSDAEGHLQRLRQLWPDAKFAIVFDCCADNTLDYSLDPEANSADL